MERSSRFISLSGLSGIAAGLCALGGAWYTSTKIECWKKGDCEFQQLIVDRDIHLQSTLLKIAFVTFAAAIVLAFLFTWMRSKKTGVPGWGFVARKGMRSVGVGRIGGG